MRPFALLALAVLAACPSPSTDSGDPDTDIDTDTDPDPEVEDLDALLEPIRAEHDLPALAAIVGDVDRITAEGAVGVRKLGDDTPVTRADKWHLGSNTKAMTATLAALYVEDGAIAWDTPISEALPDLAIHPDFADVPIEDFLSHRSGLPAAITNGQWSILSSTTTPVRDARTDFAEAVLGLPPSYTPGSRFEYANSGYIVIGAVLERLGDDTWETLLTERLWDPLGMTGECGFGAPSSAGETDQPWGHTADGTPTRLDNPPALGPAGTGHCTMAGEDAFAALHLAGASGDTDLLPATAFEALHADRGNGYALGWGVGQGVLAHNGSNTLNFHTVRIDTGSGQILVVATNAAWAGSEPYADVRDAVNAD